MKKSTQYIIAISLLLTYFHFKDGTPAKAQAEEEPQSQMTEQEIADATEFAQNLILSRDYKCEKVTTFLPATVLRKEIIVWCDDYYQYYITKPGGRWKIEPQ